MSIPDEPHEQSEANKILSELKALDRTGAVDPKVLARLDERMKKEIERSDQELARVRTKFDAERSASASRRPLPRRSPLAQFISIAGLFVLLGAFLEVTIGRRFIFSAANEYRAAMPWLFVAGCVLFLSVLWFSNAGRDGLRRRYPTQWVRQLTVIPFLGALLSGLAVVAPLGWVAALGWAFAGNTEEFQGKVTSVREPSTSSRSPWSCTQGVTLELPAASAEVCVDKRLSGPVPRNGDSVLVSARVSFAGFLIDQIRAR